MPLLQNHFLQAPLSNSAMELYNNEIVPRLTRKNKVLGVSAAIFLSLAYYIRNRIFRPPRNLRHIPYFGYFSLIKSLYKEESIFDRGARLQIPFIERSDNDGMFMEPGKTGHWEINVTNPEDANHILLKHDVFLKTDFDEVSEHTLLNKILGGENIVMIPTGAQWKSQRKVLNPAFRRSSPVKLFGELAQDLFRKMDGMSDTVDASDLMMRYTLEATGRSLYGFEFNAINDINSKWTTLFYEIHKELQDYKFFIFPFLDQQFRWFFPKRKQYHQKLAAFLEMLDEVVQHKKDLLRQGQFQNPYLGENEQDILTMMLQSNNILSEEEMKSNLYVLFYIGKNLTAAVLSFALYHLGKNPEIQQKAREEAVSILGNSPNDVIPTEKDLKQMTYIENVLKETLRINSPITRITPRLVMEDTIFQNTFIPQGSLVTIDIHNIHNSEKYWRSPKTFNPDRFSDSDVKCPPLLSFGNGTRMCVGMNYSLNQQRVILAMLLKKFTWSIPETSAHKDGLQTAGVPVTGPKGPLDITFKKIY